jgi:hypothetical protein
MSNIKKTLKEIKAFMRRNDIAPSRMATMAGLGINTLRGCMTDEWSPRLETIERLQRAIKAHGRRNK